MGQFLLITAVLLSGTPLWANSCCGQSPAQYSALPSHQKLSLSTGVSYLQSYGRFRPVGPGQEGLVVWDDKKREVTSVLLNMVGTVAQRHQVFVNTSLLQGRYTGEGGVEESNHLADTLLGYSYEIIQDQASSNWKPTILLTGLINLPTGLSPYESDLNEGADVTGHGQWGTGVGVTLRKIYFPFTISLQARTIRLLQESFGRVKVSDFYDSSMALLANYTSPWWQLQFNGGVTFTHLSERRIEPSEVTSGITQNFAVLAGVRRAISQRWVAGVSVTDQTLMGPAKNSILNRSVNLNFNYNYF